MSLVRIAGALACATSTGFFSPQSKDLRKHFYSSLSMVKVATFPSGRSSCPDYPRNHRHNGVEGLIVMFLMLTYVILLQSHGL